MPRTDSDAPTKWTPSLSDVAPMGAAPDAPAREATKWPPPPNSDIAELRANADPAITAPTKWLPLGLFSPILLTLCCCLVGGIVTIVYTTSANAKGAAGDIEGAKADAARAARWQFWSTVVGACLFLLVQAVKFSRL